MPMEIERKFLVASDDWRKEVNSGRSFKQAVIFANGDRTLRIRTVDDKQARLTLKIGVDGSLMSRHEFEYELPIADAEE